MDQRLVYDLLYVEDKHYDLEVVRAVLNDQNRRVRLSNVPNAKEAMAYLRHQNSYAEAPVPDIVMIDFNGRDEEGLALLRLIKTDPELRRLPVVCFLNGADVLAECYRCGANCCLKKPTSLDHLATLVIEIDKFWFRIARTPFTLAG